MGGPDRVYGLLQLVAAEVIRVPEKETGNSMDHLHVVMAVAERRGRLVDWLVQALADFEP